MLTRAILALLLLSTPARAATHWLAVERGHPVEVCAGDTDTHRTAARFAAWHLDASSGVAFTGYRSVHRFWVGGPGGWRYVVVVGTRTWHADPDACDWAYSEGEGV